MEIENCAPSKTRKKYSCYTPHDLNQLKSRYNKTHKRKIKTNKHTKIWMELMNRLDCKKESCLASSLQIKMDRFSPKHPEEWKKNPTAWLSSDDITNVLEQYEKAYPNFIYIGPSPSDFYFRENGTCVWEELCKFDVRKLSKNKKVGIVFNLDEHNGPGTHWVAIFIDVSKKNMYYFDSTGEDIHENIFHFYEKVKGQDSGYKLIKNHPVEHQFGNTECGVYVLFFLILMLQSNHFNHFKNKETFSDKSMEKLRKKFFNA
jgi:hypothetical protein